MFSDVVGVRAIFLLYFYVQCNLLYFYVQLNNFVILNFYVKYQNDIKMISPKRTYSCTSQKYICIYYKYTYSDRSQQHKTKHLCYFRLLWELLVIVNNLTGGQCSLLLQNAHKNNRLQQQGDRFTFNILLIFRRIGIVVPHNSHATKSTSIPKIIRPTSSDKT